MSTMTRISDATGRIDGFHISNILLFAKALNDIGDGILRTGQHRGHQERG